MPSTLLQTSYILYIFLIFKSIQGLKGNGRAYNFLNWATRRGVGVGRGGYLHDEMHRLQLALPCFRIRV